MKGVSYLSNDGSQLQTAIARVATSLLEGPDYVIKYNVALLLCLVYFIDRHKALALDGLEPLDLI